MFEKEEAETVQRSNVMCGFVGFLDHLPEKAKIIEDMKNAIVHRGPDSDGTYLDDEIALGFRRLSIIDLDAGDQPMYNEDGSLVLMFNGEIYNYQEIRKELLEKGHIFRTQSDTEVLLHAYEEYGYDMLNQLRGMFAFVIWDKQEKRMFLARDFFGIKPMYYAQMNGSFLFGSEIKAFLCHPNFDKRLNHDVLENYLTYQYSPSAETFFEGVMCLPPAHYLVYENGKTTITRYWEPEFKEAEEGLSLEDWAGEIRKVMEDSVNAHKISDVEVGSFLSSGVDSSYIACLAKVDKTFTVGFKQKKYNEISYAKELSDLIQVQNISKVITPEEYWDKLSMIQYYMDQPLADASAIALYFLGNETAKHVKVAMSGEGSDELFGGYNIYREPLENKAYDIIPFPIRRLIGKIASLFPKKWGFNFLVRHSKTLPERYVGNAFIFDEKEKDKLLKQRNGVDPLDVTRPYWARTKGKDTVTQMQYLDINVWMVHDILLKADKMSMANSLEVRVPFLDKEVFQVASRIPRQYKVEGEVTKRAFRKTAQEVLPEKVADKKKLGFPVPIRVWMREEPYYSRIKEAFTSEEAQQFFHTDYLLKLLEQHKAEKYDNSRKIWTVFMFLLWYQEYFVKRA